MAYPQLITSSFGETAMNVMKGITELYGSRYHRDPDLSEPTSRILWVDQVSYAMATT